MVARPAVPLSQIMWLLLRLIAALPAARFHMKKSCCLKSLSDSTTSWSDSEVRQRGTSRRCSVLLVLAFER
jgi:hypothetical protein